MKRRSNGLKRIDKRTGQPEQGLGFNSIPVSTPALESTSSNV